MPCCDASSMQCDNPTPKFAQTSQSSVDVSSESRRARRARLLPRWPDHAARRRLSRRPRSTTKGHSAPHGRHCSEPPIQSIKRAESSTSLSFPFSSASSTCPTCLFAFFRLCNSWSVSVTFSFLFQRAPFSTPFFCFVPSPRSHLTFNKLDAFICSILNPFRTSLH